MKKIKTKEKLGCVSISNEMNPKNRFYDQQYCKNVDVRLTKHAPFFFISWHKIAYIRHCQSTVLLYSSGVDFTPKLLCCYVRISHGHLAAMDQQESRILE